MSNKNELILTEKQTAILKKVFEEQQSEKSFAEVLKEKLPQLMEEFLTNLHSK